MTNEIHQKHSPRDELIVLRGDVQKLEIEAQLRAPIRTLNQLEQRVYRLPSRLQVLHDRGVLYRPLIGRQVTHLTSQLKEVTQQVLEASQRWRPHLQQEITALREAIQQYESQRVGEECATPKDITAEVQAVREQVTHATAEMHAPLASLEEGVQELEHQIRRLEWAAEAISNATCALEPGEVLVDASRARYHPGSGPVAEGLLFLTDQRLIFEQRQEVEVRDRFLPFRKRTQRVEAMLLDVPLDEITHLDVSRTLGSIFKGESVNLKFGPNADVPKVSLDLDGYEQMWCEFIESAREKVREGGG